MRKYLEDIPFFLMTIPVFVIVQIEKKYRHLIVYKLVIAQIVELFVIPFVIAGLFLLITKNLKKASAYTLPFLLSCYFFSDVKDSLHAWDSRSFMSSYSFLIPALTLLLSLISIIIYRSKSSFNRLFLYVNTTFFALIAFDIVIIVSQSSLNSGKNHDPSPFTDGLHLEDTLTRPDIYYVVFDGYTSSSALKAEFRYDNSHLDSFLLQRGFYVVKNSRSNYNLTPFSIASTLNGEYLQTLNTTKKFYLAEYLTGIAKVYNNKLMPALNRAGYRIYNQSIFALDGFPPMLELFDLWRFKRVYERHNIIRKINHDIGWILWRRLQHRGGKTEPENGQSVQRDNFFESTVAALRGTIGSDDGNPKFVYAHMLLPHAPYTYDSSGRKVRDQGRVSQVEQRKAYLHQVIYSNQIIRSIIDSIFLLSKKPFVIVLQGDHGYRDFDPPKNQLEFANLNAIYFFNRQYQGLHDSISNVNTFRLTLNACFNKRYPLLKDTSYFLRHK